MARRKISEMQTIVRQRYEEQLAAIPPLSAEARKLLSQEGNKACYEKEIFQGELMKAILQYTVEVSPF